MTIDIAITNDMKAFERWEMRVAKCRPFSNVWASLKRFQNAKQFTVRDR